MIIFIYTYTKMLVTLSSYSGEIIRQPPHTNNLVSVYPIFYRQLDYKHGYANAKNKYKPQLATARGREITQADVTANYTRGFCHGWWSADFMVEYEGKKQFFHTINDVTSFIYPDDQLERRPKNNKNQPIKNPQNSSRIQDKFEFEGPSKEIKTQNKEKFILHKRIFGRPDHIDHSPRDGARFNPPLLQL